MKTEQKEVSTWNQLVKIRDTATDISIKERANLYLSQLNTASGKRVEAEAQNWIITFNN